MEWEKEQGVDGCGVEVGLERVGWCWVQEGAVHTSIE